MARNCCDGNCCKRKCCEKCNQWFRNIFYRYKLDRYAYIDSWPFKVFSLLGSAMIFAGVLTYLLWWKETHLEFDQGISALSTKVKGVSYTKRFISENGVWDVADLVVPPQEDEVFFITTKVRITRKQVKSKCHGDEGGHCKNNLDCVPFRKITSGDGIQTGTCISSTVCEVYGWCPLESAKENSTTTETILLENAEDLSVFVKNNIHFRKFKTFRINIATYENKTAFRNCRYHPEQDPKCPIFNISTILKLAGIEYKSIRDEGVAVFFEIIWDCKGTDMENCFPTYNFYKLITDESNVSKGWNFRYPHYYFENAILHRDLIKAYGIRFIISVISKASRASFLEMLIKTGSGLGVALTLNKGFYILLEILIDCRTCDCTFKFGQLYICGFDLKCETCKECMNLSKSKGENEENEKAPLLEIQMVDQC